MVTYRLNNYTRILYFTVFIRLIFRLSSYIDARLYILRILFIIITVERRLIFVRNAGNAGREN